MNRTGLIMLAMGISLLAQTAQANWTASQRLTWTLGESRSPDLAVDFSGNVHVVWADKTPGNFEVYYRKSSDMGATWAASQRLTWTSGNSLSPAIGVDSSGHLHAVWADETPGNFEVYYKKSTDMGVTWAVSQRLTWTSGGSFIPAMAIDASGNPHVFWHDYTAGPAEIYYKKSTNMGATWTASRRLTWNSGNSESAAVGVDSSGHLHLFWNDSTPVQAEIYHRKSTDGGATWTASQRLTWTPGGSYSPAIAVASSGDLHLVWHDDTPGNAEIYDKSSGDAGTTWATSQRLTWTSGTSIAAAIGADSLGNIHLVWADETPGIYEIYYKMRTAGGVVWTAGQRLTWTSGPSVLPAMVIDSSDNLHLVWQDSTAGAPEIYYRKGN